MLRYCTQSRGISAMVARRWWYSEKQRSVLRRSSGAHIWHVLVNGDWQEYTECTSSVDSKCNWDDAILIAESDKYLPVMIDGVIACVEHVYMDKLISERPIAVHFQTKNEAELFFNEMKKQYPEYVRGWSRVIYNYEEYRSDGGVCYCPYFNEKYGGMTHGSRRVYEDKGYAVLEFTELLWCEDDKEICDSGLPLEFLLA